MKFFSTFPLTPTPFHNRDRYTKCFISSSISSLCLVFTLRQSSVIPVYKTNASNKLLVGGRLLASVEVTQRQPDCITWFHRLQAWSSFLSFYCPGCHLFETPWHSEMWFVNFSGFLWLEICSAAFFLPGCPDWCRMTYFFQITPGLNNLQFSLSPNRFAGWSPLPSPSGLRSMGSTLRVFQLLLPVI